MPTVCANKYGMLALFLCLAMGTWAANIVTLSAVSSEPGTEVPESANVGDAKAEYSRMTIDFGRVPIRDTYSETLEVRNTGNETLTITSIVFMDETFSTTTSLPLEIAAGSSQSVEVKYAPTVRGEVRTQMTVICNSVSKLNTIKLQAQPFAVNELHVGDASGISDEEVTVSLTMNNMDDILGFQANFIMPEALEYVDGSFELSDRKQDHIASASLHDNVLRLIGFSTSGKAFKGNDGEIAHFKVKLVGRYGVLLKPYEAILSAVFDHKTENAISADYGGQITINSPQMYTSNTLDFGDMPLTGDIKKTLTINNYGSAPLTISRIEFDNASFEVEETLPLQIETSQNKTITVVNADKTEGDFTATMQIYSNDPDQRLFDVKVTGCVFAPNYLTAAVHEASTEKVVLKVSMDNYDVISGVEFDLTAPEGYSLDEASVSLADRAQGMVVTSRQTDKYTLHVFAYMMSDGIAQGEGELMTIGLVPGKALTDGSYSLTISNILLGTEDLKDKYAGEESSTMYFEVPTAAPEDAEAIVMAKSYTRVYGEANPTFEYTSSGETLTGAPEITCLATATSAVGTYPIVIKKGTIGNSSVSYVNGTLTITKAPLTIKTGNYTRKEREENPDFEVSYEGFKNQETEAVLDIRPSVTTMATKDSPAGQYELIVSGAQAQNYEITYENGTLTIEERLLIPGDANDDGTVDEKDVKEVVDYIMGHPSEAFYAETADATGDGVINAADIVAILNIIKKK